MHLPVRRALLPISSSCAFNPPVCLDRSLSDPLFHYVNQVSANRWNHHIEVKSEAIATSETVKMLVRAGHEFAAKARASKLQK